MHMLEGFNGISDNDAYPCFTKSDCAYKGCADIPCASSSPYCNNGVWDYRCSENVWYGIVSFHYLSNCCDRHCTFLKVV